VPEEHIYNEIDKSKQWHIRVWDVDENEVAVIGQAHKDPYDHNQIGNKPWQFDSARSEALSDWNDWGYETDDSTINTGYTKWDTHDGWIGAVY